MMTVDQQNAHVINCSDDVTSQRKTSGERNPSYNDEPCAQSSRGKPENRRAGRRRRPAPFFRLTFGLDPGLAAHVSVEATGQSRELRNDDS